MVKKRCCSQWEPTTPFEALPAGFLTTYFNGCFRPSLHQFPERAALPCQSLTSAKATCYHNRTNSSQAPHVAQLSYGGRKRVTTATTCTGFFYKHGVCVLVNPRESANPTVSASAEPLIHWNQTAAIRKGCLQKCQAARSQLTSVQNFTLPHLTRLSCEWLQSGKRVDLSTQDCVKLYVSSDDSRNPCPHTRRILLPVQGIVAHGQP